MSFYFIWRSYRNAELWWKLLPHPLYWLSQSDYYNSHIIYLIDIVLLAAAAWAVTALAGAPIPYLFVRDDAYIYVPLYRPKSFKHIRWNVYLIRFIYQYYIIAKRFPARLVPLKFISLRYFATLAPLIGIRKSNLMALMTLASGRHQTYLRLLIFILS